MTSATKVSELRAKIDALRAALLQDVTQEQEEDSVPPEEESVRIRAFIVLAHGGIEELIEECIAARVAECFTEAEPGAPLVSVPLAITFASLLSKQNSDKVLDPSPTLKALPGLFKSNSIGANHGIRRKHIEAICKPLGLSLDAFEPTSSLNLPALETLAAKRGTTAHTLQEASTEVIFASQADSWINNALDSVENLLNELLPAII